MKISKKLFFIFLISVSVFSCVDDDEDILNKPHKIIKKGETLIVGAYLRDCYCIYEQKCLTINGEQSCEDIIDFEHKEGVWFKIRADLFQRDPRIMDVKLEAYIFKSHVDSLSEKEASPEKLCAFYGGIFRAETTECTVENPALQYEYCRTFKKDCNPPSS